MNTLSWRNQFDPISEDQTGSRTGAVAYVGEVADSSLPGNMFDGQPRPIDPWRCEHQISNRTWVPVYHRTYAENPQPIHFMTARELNVIDQRMLVAVMPPQEQNPLSSLQSYSFQQPISTPMHMNASGGGGSGSMFETT